MLIEIMSKNIFYLFFFSTFFFSFTKHVCSQSKIKKQNLVYVDKQGVLRWAKTNGEAAFFGVNYTVPFAYGYRSLKALNVDIEKAIDADVYHFARLGLDAFRVHMWDVEISDSSGNLLENEHLRLFDYLLYKLKQRNIKILITPIAFWGNGYPEPDEKTIGFSSVYGKDSSVVLEAPIKAQENYLQQIVKHVNPYTKLSYKDDPDIIAAEINNEPHHSGLKEKTTKYINRLAVALKTAGWTKPIFYNISESPTYAGAVTKANVDGHSFQWYPTGLVAGHEQKGNFLPNVDQYKIPFGDSIPQFNKRAKAVYEFDAGDVLQSNMYPAMARSFRTAGFQWATQFAYDPMATAYANTEYQTHYLNLAYTPSKAISLLIASKVFHKLPVLKSYGTYPADTLFDVFRVSYKNQLSEMNSDSEFYYSNSTNTLPKNISKLQHIAGVGSSAVVKYDGYGAYFLDKIKDDVWRLEVMPDAIFIHDPFEKASPQKKVTIIHWQNNRMQIMLNDLSKNLSVQALNKNNLYNITSSGATFFIQPGTYLLINKNRSNNVSSYSSKIGEIGMNEFIAPKTSDSLVVVHSSFTEVSAKEPFNISAKIVGIDSVDKVSAELHNSSDKWRTVPLQRMTSYDYAVQVPEEIVMPGFINYRIIIQGSNNEFHTFPGDYGGNPYAWDYYRNDTWQAFVASENMPLKIFNTNTDRNNLMVYNPDWRNNFIEYISADEPGQLVLKATMKKPSVGKIMGWQFYFADKIKGRTSEISSFKTIVIKARTENESPTRIRVALINGNGIAFCTSVTLNNLFQNIKIPLNTLRQDSSLLLPRPYPGFLPLWFKANTPGNFYVGDIEKVEITFGQDISENDNKPYSIELESIWLNK